MMDDSAFLERLREHPGDDMTRLIYADWLEERGDARGELLRMEVEFAALDEGSDRAAELATRMRDARKGLDRAWLRQAGKRFDLWLLSYHPALKIAVLNVRRELTGMGLAEPKTWAWAESLPALVMGNLTLSEVEALRTRLVQYDDGARARTTPEPGFALWVLPAENPAPRAPEKALVGDSEGRFEVVLRSCQPEELRLLALKLRSLPLLDVPETFRIGESSLPCVVASGVDHYTAETLRRDCESVGIAEVEVRQLP
jgi:uncharacterized protein (TIGR02996 family)